MLLLYSNNTYYAIKLDNYNNNNTTNYGFRDDDFNGLDVCKYNTSYNQIEYELNYVILKKNYNLYKGMYIMPEYLQHNTDLLNIYSKSRSWFGNLHTTYKYANRSYFKNLFSLILDNASHDKYNKQSLQCYIYKYKVDNALRLMKLLDKNNIDFLLNKINNNIIKYTLEPKLHNYNNFINYEVGQIIALLNIDIMFFKKYIRQLKYYDLTKTLNYTIIHSNRTRRNKSFTTTVCTTIHKAYIDYMSDKHTKYTNQLYSLKIATGYTISLTNLHKKYKSRPEAVNLDTLLFYNINTDNKPYYDIINKLNFNEDLKTINNYINNNNIVAVSLKPNTSEYNNASTFIDIEYNKLHYTFGFNNNNFKRASFMNHDINLMNIINEYTNFDGYIEFKSPSIYHIGQFYHNFHSEVGILNINKNITLICKTDNGDEINFSKEEINGCYNTELFDGTNNNPLHKEFKKIDFLTTINDVIDETIQGPNTEYKNIHIYSYIKKSMETEFNNAKHYKVNLSMLYDNLNNGKLYKHEKFKLNKATTELYQSKNKDSYRILSFNVHNFYNLSKKYTDTNLNRYDISSFVDYINDGMFDIICLQEYTGFLENDDKFPTHSLNNKHNNTITLSSKSFLTKLNKPPAIDIDNNSVFSIDNKFAFVNNTNSNLYGKASIILNESIITSHDTNSVILIGNRSYIRQLIKFKQNITLLVYNFHGCVSLVDKKYELRNLATVIKHDLLTFNTSNYLICGDFNIDYEHNNISLLNTFTNNLQMFGIEHESDKTKLNRYNPILLTTSNITNLKRKKHTDYFMMSSNFYNLIILNNISSHKTVEFEGKTYNIIYINTPKSNASDHFPIHLDFKFKTNIPKHDGYLKSKYGGFKTSQYPINTMIPANISLNSMPINYTKKRVNSTKASSQIPALYKPETPRISSKKYNTSLTKKKLKSTVKNTLNINHDIDLNLDEDFSNVLNKIYKQSSYRADIIEQLETEFDEIDKHNLTHDAFTDCTPCN